jgi:hypothetical protein
MIVCIEWGALPNRVGAKYAWSIDGFINITLTANEWTTLYIFWNDWITLHIFG